MNIQTSRTVAGGRSPPNGEPTETDSASDDFEASWGWPVASDSERRLRLNDTFGPRVLTSQNRYDFHRGIDISRDVGTPIYAVADGEISIAGSHTSYEDRTVQIKHLQEDGSSLISHYTHLSAVVDGLIEGLEVEKGEIIAYSGQGSSSYPHLHFEIRRSDNGSSYQRNAIHPLALLPYEDQSLPSLIVESIERSDNLTSISLSITVSRTELDLVGAELEISDPAGVIMLRSIDFNEWNAAHQDTSTLDNPELYGISISPDEYNDNLGQDWRLVLNVTDMALADGQSLDATFRAWDVLGGFSEAHFIIPAQ